MDTTTIKQRYYRDLVDESAKHFGVHDWHAKTVKYRNHPGKFARKFLGSTWWSAQEDIGRTLAQRRRVVVRSGNGVGKTYLAADLALWFLFTHRPSIVVTAAPTDRQVRHVLWHEIRRRCLQVQSSSISSSSSAIHRQSSNPQSAIRNPKSSLPGRLYQTRLTIDADSFAIGLSAEKGVNFQGFHCENLLVIFDEASGIPEEIWDAAEGVAVGDNNKILAIGNPLRSSGRFYQLFKSSTAWRKYTINALEHPNITQKGRPIQGCITIGHLEEKLTDWCERIESSSSSISSSSSALDVSPGGRNSVAMGANPWIPPPNPIRPIPFTLYPRPETRDPTSSPGKEQPTSPTTSSASASSATSPPARIDPSSPSAG